MGHGTWVLWFCVVRCALYQHICISLYFFCYRTPFFHCVLCSSRLDLEYTCTLNRVTFIPSMSNRWEQELQRCLEADVDFDVGDFIARHPQIAPRTIRRRHASMRQTLMKRLNKRAKGGVQSSSMASLNTAQAQAAEGCTWGRGNTPQVQAAKGSRNTSAAQAAKGASNTSAAQAAKGTRNTSAAQAAKGSRNTSAAQAAKGARITSAAQAAKGGRNTSAAQAVKGARNTSAAQGTKGASEAGSDPRGHLGVTWGVYLCAGKPPLADIILSHPPELTRCDSVIGLAIPATSGHIQYRGAAS